MGEEGQLKGLGLVNGVWLALDENAWDDMLDAQNQGAKVARGMELHSSGLPKLAR